MPNLDSQTIQLVIVAAVAAALLLQTIFLLAILATVRKMARSFKEEVEDLRSSVMPVVYNTRDLLARVTPQIESTVEDLALMARGMRQQTAELQASAKDVLDRLQVQAGRLDAMVTSVLDTVDRASAFVAETVSKPVRQISGLLASVKAVVESLRTAESSRNVHTPGDDTFV